MTGNRDQSGDVDAHDIVLDGIQLADLELALMGARLPSPQLGATSAAPSAPVTAPTEQVELLLPPAHAGRLTSHRDLRLLDAEHTPIASLSISALSGDDAVVGLVQPGRRPEAGAFRAWRHRPDDMPPLGRGRLTVLVARAPLTADIEWVRSRSHHLGCDVVWLVPVVNPTPDGIPPGVLLRSVDTAAAAIPGSQVVAVPLWWRGSSYDGPLGQAVARAWQATYAMTLTAAGVCDSATAVTNGASIVEPESQSAREAWRVLVGALDGVAPGTTPPAADRVAALVPKATAQQLLRWRPPRTERGLVVLLTGLSGSGKSTLARALAQQLEERYDRRTSLLDGDVVRALLSSGLGFDAASRDLNVRRIGFVAAEVARHGGIAVCAPIAPYQRSRDAVRTMAREVGDFLLVHVCTPIEECERRDLKGLYAKARAGQLEGFTGISDPYEEPEDADLLIDTLRLGPQEALETLLKHLEQGGWVSGVPEVGAWTGH